MAVTDHVRKQARRMMTTGMRLAGRHDDERGQGLVEYALILLLVSTAALVALQNVGGGLTGLYSTVTAAFP